MPPISLHLPEWFVSGGATMWVLALLSVIALATLISKILQFARIRPGNSRQADQLLNALHQGKQPGEPGKLNSPIDRVLWQCWQNRNLDEAAWQEESLRLARSGLDELRGGLRVLEVISAIAPFLGSAGLPEFGMIGAFPGIGKPAAHRWNRPIFPGGILEALLDNGRRLNGEIRIWPVPWANRSSTMPRKIRTLSGEIWPKHRFRLWKDRAVGPCFDRCVEPL